MHNRLIQEAAEKEERGGKVHASEADTEGGGFIPHSDSQFLRISLPGHCCCCCSEYVLSGVILFHIWTWIWPNNEEWTAMPSLNLTVDAHFTLEWWTWGLLPIVRVREQKKVIV